jgi:crotonobetainyl-CoA:carnitine CoA-transferase CaiB-like acyl-CoA transferase
MALPLSGLLVLSLEQAVAAPMCSCRLADAGARVIKVERPEGDFARYYDRRAQGESAYFVWLNRGKESVCLDLTRSDDKALFAAMLAKADVLVQNLKPGAIAKLGFALDRVEAVIARERCGEGATLSVAMFDAMADWMTVPLLQYEGGMAPQRMGLAHTSIAPYGVFKTKDGADILISIQSDREWRVLAEQVLEDTALAQDKDFATNVRRVERRRETDARVASVFAATDEAALTEKLLGADIAFARVNDTALLARHPHLRRIDVATPSGKVSYPAPATRQSGAPRSYGRVPALGEHTASIRAEFMP